MVEVRAKLKHLRMSPKKVRLVTDAVKGLSVQDALVRLQFIQKASSPIIIKLLRSAMANADHNNNLKPDMLMVKQIIVDQAVPLKRWKPAAFGSAHPFKKHGCHIDLVLGLKPGVTDPTQKKADRKQKGEADDAKKKVETKEVAISEVPRTLHKTNAALSKEGGQRRFGPSAEKRSIKKTRGSISDN